MLRLPPWNDGSAQSAFPTIGKMSTRGMEGFAPPAGYAADSSVTARFDDKQ